MRNHRARLHMTCKGERRKRQNDRKGGSVSIEATMLARQATVQRTRNKRLGSQITCVMD